MNYQYPYRNPYNNRKRNEKSYLVKLARQLSIVLFMLLFIVLFKYVKTGASETINTKIVNIINLDYTNKLNNLLEDNLKNINKYVDGKFAEITAKEDFKFSFYPIDDKITSNFGDRINPITKVKEKHEGIDITAKEGTDVKAVFDGVVEKVENNKTLGLMVSIDHNNGYKTVYGHLSEIEVNEGEDISVGSVIAKSGNTGLSTGPHLHFEVHKDNIPVNPMDYLPKKI
jgi:murein DD-endopeptidase MepM/ murein hydrolase activator NlpD